MIERTATRFDQENWFKTEIDKSVPSCEVTGELDGVPVSFFGNIEEGLIIGGEIAWNQTYDPTLIISNTISKYPMYLLSVNP